MARSPRRRSKSLATGFGRLSRCTKPSNGSNAARIQCSWTLTLKFGLSLKRQISRNSWGMDSNGTENPVKGDAPQKSDRKRCPNPMLVDSDIEIRPEFEAADFAQ